MTFSPASQLSEGTSREYRSGTGALNSLHWVHRCQWAGRNWRSKWKLAYPIMALTSGRHPSLITSLLTEWAIWAAEKAATGPLPSWWPCPLGAAPARQPGGAGRGRRSSFTPPSWSLDSRCYDSSTVTEKIKERPHSSYLTQLVSDSCARGGWWVLVGANLWQSHTFCLFSRRSTQAMQELEVLV